MRAGGEHGGGGGGGEGGMCATASLYINRALRPSGWPTPDHNWEASPRDCQAAPTSATCLPVTTKAGKGYVHFSRQDRERPNFQMKKTRVFLGTPPALHLSAYVHPRMGLPHAHVTSRKPHTHL